MSSKVRVLLLASLCGLAFGWLLGAWPRSTPAVRIDHVEVQSDWLSYEYRQVAEVGADFFLVVEITTPDHGQVVHRIPLARAAGAALPGLEPVAFGWCMAGRQAGLGGSVYLRSRGPAAGYSGPHFSDHRLS